MARLYFHFLITYLLVLCWMFKFRDICITQSCVKMSLVFMLDGSFWNLAVMACVNSWVYQNRCVHIMRLLKFNLSTGGSYWTNHVTSEDDGWGFKGREYTCIHHFLIAVLSETRFWTVDCQLPTAMPRWALLESPPLAGHKDPQWPHPPRTFLQASSPASSDPCKPTPTDSQFLPRVCWSNNKPVHPAYTVAATENTTNQSFIVAYHDNRACYYC